MNKNYVIAGGILILVSVVLIYIALDNEALLPVKILLSVFAGILIGKGLKGKQKK